MNRKAVESGLRLHGFAPMRLGAVKRKRAARGFVTGEGLRESLSAARHGERP
jgi:hypothetical protein